MVPKKSGLSVLDDGSGWRIKCSWRTSYVGRPAASVRGCWVPLPSALCDSNVERPNQNGSRGGCLYRQRILGKEILVGMVTETLSTCTAFHAHRGCEGKLSLLLSVVCTSTMFAAKSA